MKTLEHKRLWRRLYRRKVRARYVLEHPAIRSGRACWTLTPQAREYLAIQRATAFWRRQAQKAMVAR